jgi:hypothetical protein
VIGPWFIDVFAAATGLAAVHYVVLLPPEQTCLERVQSRVGHGFTDLSAARHMYQAFADAVVDDRHVIASTERIDLIASRIYRLIQDEAALWQIDAH